MLQESKKINKQRIEEIVNYLLENHQTIIQGKYAMVNGINLDLSDEDDEYISYIREDVDALNAVLKGINKKTTENLKSKISRFMNIGSTQRYNSINAFKITELGEFPVELYNFKNLTILQLIDGDINEIPQDINKLSNLLELSISNCTNISELPDSLTRLNNLMILEISDTRISRLPENIGNLPNLRELILNKNPNLDMDTLPVSLIENRNIILKDNSSDFYKKEMVIENISDTNKSTIVLAISGHGLDLCDETLDVNLNKLLYFSHAPKYEYAISTNECPSINRINDLMREFNYNKTQISDVIEKLENVSSDVYNLRDMLTEESNKELTEERNKKLKENRNILLQNEANLIFKVRAMKNDHSYFFRQNESEEWEGKYGIYILDIRNPKNEIQNNYKLISKKLNLSNRIKLSDILNICYEIFSFDYVSIIDMTCRSNSETLECNLENIHKKRGEQLEEIIEGMKYKKNFENYKLGGKSRKRIFNKKNKKSLRKRKSLKKRKSLRKRKSLK
jgi:Leucine-rich repeat (LRR) protein